MSLYMHITHTCSAVCRCAEAQSEKTREFFVEYNKELELMEKRFQDDSYDDFAVVLQPFMAGVDLPKASVFIADIICMWQA